MLPHSFGVETVLCAARKPIQIMFGLALTVLVLAGFTASIAEASVLKVDVAGADSGNCQAQACANLTYAIGQSVDGDTIEVGPGQFPSTAAIVVNKAVTIAGAQAGVDARDRDVPATEETVITGGSFSGALIRLNAVGVTLDGVTVRGHDRPAIQTLNSQSGYTVRNTIMTDNNLGIYLASTATNPLPTVVERNRFEANNRPGLQSGIYGDHAMNDVTIQDNLFTGHVNVPINVAGPTQQLRNGIVIADNKFIEERQLLLLQASDVVLSGNTFKDGRTRSISVEGGVEDLTIDSNVIEGTVDAGIMLVARYNAGANRDVTISNNSISRVKAGTGGTEVHAGAGIVLAAEQQGPGYTGVLEVTQNRIVDNAGGAVRNNLETAVVHAPNNWWGCNEGPGTAGCDAVSGDVDTLPNVVLTAEATPARMLAGNAAAVNASLGTNSAGEAVSLPVLEGRQLTFETTKGSITPASGTISHGSVAAQFSAAEAIGAATIAAAFDGEVEGAEAYVGARPGIGKAMVTGSGVVGEALTCVAEQVNGLPEPQLNTVWLRAGSEILGQSGANYTPVESDIGVAISCRIAVTNEFGSAGAESDSISVTKAPTPPNPPKPPVIRPENRVTVPKSGRAEIMVVKCADACRIKAPKRVRVKIKGKVYSVRVKAPARVAKGGTARVRLILPARARRAIANTRARARVKVVITTNKGQRRVVNRSYVLRGRKTS